MKIYCDNFINGSKETISFENGNYYLTNSYNSIIYCENHIDTIFRRMIKDNENLSSSANKMVSLYFFDKNSKKILFYYNLNDGYYYDKSMHKITNNGDEINKFLKDAGLNGNGVFYDDNKNKIKIIIGVSILVVVISVLLIILL